MRVKLAHAKFQRPTPRGTFSNLGLNEGGRKNVRFSTANWPYLGNGERYGQGYYKSLIGSGIRLFR